MMRINLSASSVRVLAASIFFSSCFVNSSAQSRGLGIYAQNPTIIGGKNVEDIKKVQWQVGIALKSKGAVGGYLCGASLIDRDWVLTAAHCLYRDSEGSRFDASELVVFGQSTNLYDTEKRNVANLVVHEAYSPQNFRNDLALIRLESPFGSSKPIDLATQSLEDAAWKIGSDTQVQVFGWGKRTVDDGVSPILQTAFLLPVPNNVCGGPDVYPGQIYPEMLCAGVPNKGTCQGDSGGPAVVALNGQLLQMGVVSAAEGCAANNRPTILTRIAAFRDWITSQKQKFGGCTPSELAKGHC